MLNRKRRFLLYFIPRSSWNLEFLSESWIFHLPVFLLKLTLGPDGSLRVFNSKHSCEMHTKLLIFYIFSTCDKQFHCCPKSESRWGKGSWEMQDKETSLQSFFSKHWLKVQYWFEFLPLFFQILVEQNILVQLLKHIAQKRPQSRFVQGLYQLTRVLGCLVLCGCPPKWPNVSNWGPRDHKIPKREHFNFLKDWSLRNLQLYQMEKHAMLGYSEEFRCDPP